MKIGIVGLGLIGGSFAKAIKKNTNCTVFGFDINEATFSKALLISAIDGKLTDENIGECDFVLVSLYPIATMKYIKENADSFKNGAIVVDCCGVKGNICRSLKEIADKAKFTFIGGHPMAGREFSGFEYSDEYLFDGASMILTPYGYVDINIDIGKGNMLIDDPMEIPIDNPIDTHADKSIDKMIEKLKKFFLLLGFDSVVITTPDDHDRMIAYTSQLAHVVSSAYVKSSSALRNKGFSAGSFKDLTRVARLNEEMWTELFFENKNNLIVEVDDIINNLKKYSFALKNNDKDMLRELLKEGREIKESLEKVRK